MEANETLGLYVHVPFCRRKCPYCDFYSVLYKEDLVEAYVQALLRSMERAPEGPSGPVDSLYFGGGTPALLSAGQLLRILEAAAKRYALTSDCEITLEANPAVLTLEQLRALKQGGFNRVSMGVQSAVEDQLQTLGRLHSVREAQEAVALCRQAGFDNVSVDLMLATPGQRPEDVDRFCQLFCPQVEHVSAYLLKIEENTPFGRQHMERSCPSEDEAADLYLRAVEQLASWGFDQYEISNFARPGRESRHNSRYWKLQPYLGFGPAAHSFWQGQRAYFPRDLGSFIASENPWQLWQPDGQGGDFFEYIMLGLRLREGISFADCARRYPEVDLSLLKKQAALLQSHGLARLSDQGLALTVQGFLLSNSAISFLLEDY